MSTSTVYATYHALNSHGDDQKAVIYHFAETNVFNVSFYTNHQFVYSVAKSFECSLEARQCALTFIAGMVFDVVIAE